MELQSVCLGISAPKFGSLHHRLSIVSGSEFRFGNQRLRLGAVTKCLVGFERKGTIIICSNASSPDGKLEHSETKNSTLPIVRFDAVEPFRGKSGSVSFHGLTHQLIEERKLVSAPFNEDKGSFLWVLGPVALISSLILPQFFLGGMFEILLGDLALGEIVSSVIFEVMFYIGLGTFLNVTDHVQRPYLQFSAKRWGLITGLRGYLNTAFFTMGIKVMIPVIVTYVSWPLIGLPALAAVAPFLAGFAAQLAFETILDKRGSSCWPLVPIIFEVYRLYQLTKGAHFLQGMLFTMKKTPITQQLSDKGNAIFAMILSFQLLGVVCLWSLITFLLRLFPSRPVSENY